MTGAITKLRPGLACWQRLLSTASGPQRCGSAAIQLNLEDGAAAFQPKSTWELFRALAVLKISSIDMFVDNSLTIMKACQSVIGIRAFSLLLRPTFYGQFVGGETEAQLAETGSRLNSLGMGLMVCPVQEEDVGEAAEGTQFEAKYDENTAYIVDVANNMGKIQVDQEHQLPPNLQCKITAFMSGDLVKKLTDLLQDGTYTLSELSKYLAEGMLWSSDSPATLPPIASLSSSEMEHLSRGLHRINKLCQSAADAKLRILVDAEYTYLNPGISVVALAMMRQYNKDDNPRPLVGNTYQCYLRKAFDTVAAERAIAEKEGFKFAAKIVRGAYLEKERLMAEKGNYPDPVNPTYEATGAMYNRVVSTLMKDLSAGDPALGFVVVATHNEDSVKKAVGRAQEMELLDENKGGKLAFAQIFGMAEQISLPLARANLPVYKSVPFGPMSEVLPYLSRRAAENRAVISGARKERQLLAQELKRRITG